jgi:hypothetical protein
VKVGEKFLQEEKLKVEERCPTKLVIICIKILIEKLYALIFIIVLFHGFFSGVLLH